MTSSLWKCRNTSSKALLLLTLVLAVSCDTGPQGTPHPNDAPVVRITGGPLDGSRESYTARIYWAGYDDDGIINHFEYALDPPLGIFDEAEIAHPETSPSVATEVIPGPTQNTDTLRVSKAVEGIVYSFDWVETSEFSRNFAFLTPQADTTSQGGNPAPTGSYSGLHTIYVRAQDNQGAYSEFDRIAYTATTQTPTSTILRPRIEAEILSVGPTLTLTVTGIDPDSPEANKKPTGYVSKLLRLDTLQPSIPLIVVSSPNILFSKGDPTWVYQSADTSELTLLLATPAQYVFGVRAVDMAGAVEPFLDWGRNAFKFQALPGGGRPDLIVTEPALGTFPRREGTAFRGTGRVEEVDVPLGLKLRFSWSATAESYGGEIEAYSWGLDVADLEREGPNSGWNPWGPDTRTLSPLLVSTPGFHVFYVRARDLGGVVSMATIVLHVVDSTFDREVLFVDDSLDGISPRDNEHDAFWRELIAGYEDLSPGQVSEFHVHGTDDTQNQVPKTPSLEFLFRHRLVIWENKASGFNGQSGLLSATSMQPLLGPYLSAGGKLWVGGAMSVSAMVPSTNEVTADFNYPKNMQNLKTSFAYQFLKLHSTRIGNDKGSDTRNTLLQVRPIDPGTAIYDTMDVDTTKLPPLQARIGGIGYSDAVFDAMFVEQEAGFRGDVDSLYVYGAAGPILYGRGSGYEDKLVALRWHDPDPGRLQGRVQWFGFPLYYMELDQAQETFNRSLDWFREETIERP
jgi:hypothetical protein